MQFRKLAAIGGSALMTGLSLAGAAMAATNVGNLADLAMPVSGAAHFPLFVVGKDAKTSDVAGAIGVAARFAAESKTKVAATTSPLVGAVEGGVNLATATVPMYVGDRLTIARSSLSSAELPNILKSEKFSDGSGTTYSYDQYVDLGTTAAPIYGKTGDLTEPTPYVNMTTSVSTSSYLYALRAVFTNAINITKGTTGAGETTSSANSATGQTIKLFGSEWSVGVDTTATKLVLYGSGDKATLKYQQPVTLSIGGTNHTIEFVGSESATKAQIKVDGAQDAYNEGSIYNKGSPTFTIYVKDVIQLSSTDQTQNSVVLQLGANKLSLPNGAAAQKGVNDDTVSGSVVDLIVTSTTAGNAGYGQLTKLVVYESASDSNKAYIKEGGEFVDPVFGTVKMKFSGYTPSLTSATDRDTVTFGQSSSDLSVKIPEAVSGKTVEVKWAFDSTTSTSGTLLALNESASRAYVLVEGHPISKDDYFIVEAAGEGHLFRYSSADQTATTGTNLGYNFNDVFSGESKKAAYASSTNATSVSMKVNGQDVYVSNLTTAHSGRTITEPIIAVTWKSGSDPSWRDAPATTEADGVAFGGTTVSAASSPMTYVTVWPGIKLKSGYKMFLTAPNTTFGADYNGNVPYAINMSLLNTSVQRFLLPTGYLSALWRNETGTSLTNITWLNISATDTGTLTSVSNSTTASAIGGVTNGASALHAAGRLVPILVGRQWYGITTNYTAAGVGGIRLQFSLLDEPAANTLVRDSVGNITQPALLFVSPKDDNQNRETFWVPATDTSTGAALTGSIGTSETSGVTWFSAASSATPTTTRYFNLWGALIEQDTNSQGKLSVTFPKSQTYATALMLEKTSTGASTTAATGDSFNVIKVTADVARLDTELSATDKTNSDLIVVGGPCVNKVAADLLGKTYPACADETATSEADALSKTGIPKNAAIVKVFADKYATGKVAVLIAGWRAGDTDLAAGAVQQDKLVGKTDTAVKVSGTDVATATIGAFS